MQFDMPVSPYIASVGDTQPIANVVLSLLGLTDSTSLCFTGDPASSGSFGKLQSSSIETEMQALADFGFTGATSVKSRTKSQIYYFLWDVLVTKPVPNPDATSVIVSAEYGIGARIAVVAFNIQVDGEVTATSVAASASLGVGSVMCEAVVVGAGLDAVKPLEPLVAISAAPFTISAMTTLGQIQGALNTLIADQGDKLPCSIVSVTLDTDRVARTWFKDDPASGTLTFEAMLRAQTFALERAYRWVICADALKDAQNLSQAVITDTYANVLGLGKTDPVTEIAHQIANDILMAGR